MMSDKIDLRRRRIHFRAWHRGTREADMLIGGFSDRFLAEWTDAELDWFEDLLTEQDVDIIAWAFGRGEPPARFAGPLLDELMKLDYIGVAW